MPGSRSSGGRRDSRSSSCSFCGKSQKDAGPMVEGPKDVYICGSCVELWIRTTNGDDYAIKVDPRYWNAKDPGDLYAALWAELDQEGQLQLEDINGALHVFPAGLIQQIEARACS